MIGLLSRRLRGAAFEVSGNGRRVNTRVESLLSLGKTHSRAATALERTLLEDARLVAQIWRKFGRERAEITVSMCVWLHDLSPEMQKELSVKARQFRRAEENASSVRPLPGPLYRYTVVDGHGVARRCFYSMSPRADRTLAISRDGVPRRERAFRIEITNDCYIVGEFPYGALVWASPDGPVLPFGNWPAPQDDDPDNHVLCSNFCRPDVNTEEWVAPSVQETVAAIAERLRF